MKKEAVVNKKKYIYIWLCGDAEDSPEKIKLPSRIGSFTVLREVCNI